MSSVESSAMREVEHSPSNLESARTWMVSPSLMLSFYVSAFRLWLYRQQLAYHIRRMLIENLLASVQVPERRRAPIGTSAKSSPHISQCGAPANLEALGEAAERARNRDVDVSWSGIEFAILVDDCNRIVSLAVYLAVLSVFLYVGWPLVLDAVGAVVAVGSCGD